VALLRLQQREGPPLSSQAVGPVALLGLPLLFFSFTTAAVAAALVRLGPPRQPCVGRPGGCVGRTHHPSSAHRAGSSPTS